MNENCCDSINGFETGESIKSNDPCVAMQQDKQFKENIIKLLD
jgi:hypothetical protein